MGMSLKDSSEGTCYGDEFVVEYWQVTVCILSRTIESGIKLMVSSRDLQFVWSYSISNEMMMPFLQAAASSTCSTARRISSLSGISLMLRQQSKRCIQTSYCMALITAFPRENVI
jgi:hypothetical protein